MLNSSINDELVNVAGDLVLEIGPGTGSLTNVLIKAGASVIAIEKDEAASCLTDVSLQKTEHRLVNIFVNFLFSWSLFLLLFCFSDPEYKVKVERSNFFHNQLLMQLLLDLNLN